jgi:serine/threonine-protein kinase RsbW
METDIKLELRSHPRLLCSVRKLVREYLKDCGFDDDQCGDVVLAVDEACTNAMRHSYEGREDERLYLTIHTSPEWVEFELRDEGHPAPEDRVQPKDDDELDAESLDPGGLGVQLMYKVFDEVSFLPGEKRGNRVLMRLKPPEKSAS